MLIYLLKATIVWAVSLLLFEALFRKNGYHAANRAYLIGSLLAGFVLPLVEIQLGANAAATTTQQFVNELNNLSVDENLATPDAVSPAASWLNLENVILLFYLPRLAFACFRLVKQAVTLIRISRRAERTVVNGYILLETAKHHGPFSFFNFIFINSADTYSEEELAMIIAHERQHGRLLHSVDVLLIESLRSILWFHPLIHVYAERLRLVHEYEADAAAAQTPETYGRFLVEQAMLGLSPTLTHSLHSRLKPRIKMLTGNNKGAMRAIRYAAIIPMIAGIMLLFSQPAHTEERKKVGNKIYYKGNEITVKEYPADTVYVENPATGKTDMRIVTRGPMPVALNGEEIFDGVDRNAIYAGTERNARAEFFKRTRDALSHLPDGIYEVTPFATIVDKNGKLAYDEGVGINLCYTCKPEPGEPAIPPRGDSPYVPREVLDEVTAKLNAELAKGLPYKPALKDGKPVNSFLSGDDDLVFMNKNAIVVQNGKARMRGTK